MRLTGLSTPVGKGAFGKGSFRNLSSSDRRRLQDNFGDTVRRKILAPLSRRWLASPALVTSRHLIFEHIRQLGYRGDKLHTGDAISGRADVSLVCSHRVS